jgi:hypothetical protein
MISFSDTGAERLSTPTDTTNSLDALEFLDKGGKVCIIIDTDGDGSSEEPVVRIYVNGAQQGVCLFAYYGGDSVYHSYVVIAHHTEGDIILP